MDHSVSMSHSAGAPVGAPSVQERDCLALARVVLRTRHQAEEVALERTCILSATQQGQPAATCQGGSGRRYNRSAYCMATAQRTRPQATMIDIEPCVRAPSLFYCAGTSSSTALSCSARFSISQMISRLLAPRSRYGVSRYGVRSENCPAPHRAVSVTCYL